MQKIHAALRDNEKRIQILEEEKEDLQKDVYKWKGKYDAENSRRLDLENEQEKAAETIKALEVRINVVVTENEKELSRTST